MLVPAIDLQGGRVVQLVQGERLAYQTDDLDGWIERFSRFPEIQVIDLDAAAGRSGANRNLVAYVCGKLTCRVGGGIRSASQARSMIDLGAASVIAGSALFPGGQPDPSVARELSLAIGADRLIAAIDARAGRVVVDAWRVKTEVGPLEAIRVLEPFCGGFLYTHVDTEGLLGGTDFETALALRRATTRKLTVAGGVRSLDEVNRLDAAGIDAVVGMAVYTGLIPLDA
jgi:phosphoribosylformimino-5-aminoimidazole carboxamide ribotide isomerase